MKKLKNFFLFLLASLLMAGSPVDRGHQVGDKATTFSLKNVDGKLVSLEDYKNNKGVILIFTCNTCPFSKMYEQRIIDLENKYSAQGYPVLAINPNDPKKAPGDSFEEMVNLAKRQNYPFPYLYDADQSIAKAYGATNTPHVYLLHNNEGSFHIAYIGAIDNNARDASQASKKYIESAIDALNTGKEVKMKHTKAIGCTIKWKAS